MLQHKPGESEQVELVAELGDSLSGAEEPKVAAGEYGSQDGRAGGAGRGRPLSFPPIGSGCQAMDVRQLCFGGRGLICWGNPPVASLVVLFGFLFTRPLRCRFPFELTVGR